MVTPLLYAPSCPICRGRGKNRDEDLNLTPFCSDRCKRLDLAKWLTEGYSLELSEFAELEMDPYGEPN